MQSAEKDFLWRGQEEAEAFSPMHNFTLMAAAGEPLKDVVSKTTTGAEPTGPLDMTFSFEKKVERTKKAGRSRLKKNGPDQGVLRKPRIARSHGRRTRGRLFTGGFPRHRRKPNKTPDLFGNVGWKPKRRRSRHFFFGEGEKKAGFCTRVSLKFGSLRLIFPYSMSQLVERTAKNTLVTSFDGTVKKAESRIAPLQQSASDIAEVVSCHPLHVRWERKAIE